MNDAVECYIEVCNALLKGSYESSLCVTSANLIEKENGYGLIIRQGNENAFTLWFSDLIVHENLYRYHEIGHFWVKGQEQWRQLVYMTGTIADKYLYMGEKYCNEKEKFIQSLIYFSPFRRLTSVPDDLMESIEPFDFKDAVPFQTAYLAGYMADKYDVSAEESIARANERVKRSTEDNFKSTVSGYTSVTTEQSSVRLHDGSAKYALYPVWILNTTWNGKQYRFAMNGQNGKFVGDLPVDNDAAKTWMIGLSAAFAVAAYGISWLLWLARII